MIVTMKDIAKKAGVSVVTVSRALNQKPDINKETREQILKIAQELNYTPDSLAKSMVTKKTRTLGIIVPAMDHFFAEVVDGISKESLERGYSVVLCNSHESADKELELIRLLRQKRVDGMLIYPIQSDQRYIEELRNSPIPFVFLNRHTDDLDCDYVINDNVYGAFAAVSHLIEKGYRRIIYICAKPTASSGKERMEGCRKAFLENGLPLSQLQILTCEENIKCCYHLVKQLMSENKQVDAIFVWDDRLAIGAIKAIFEAEIRIAQDVAVVGYDDIEISEFLFPALTTVRQPSHEIGVTATRILIDKLESEHESELKRIVLTPELIIRQTT